MTGKTRQQNIRRFLVRPVVLLAIMVLSLSAIPAFLSAASISNTEPGVTTNSTDLSTTPDRYVPPLEIEHTGKSAVVIDASRQRLLYDKSGQIKQNIPAASKIMAAFLACERLPLNTPVTISKVSEEAEKYYKCPDGIVLKSGDKYPLEYLLLRLVFYNSDSAAIAIAEQISGVEEKFVELMNTRTESLNLANTRFENVTGKAVIQYTPSESSIGIDDNQNLVQYTTSHDLARLVAVAFQNQVFSRLFCLSSNYIVLDDDSLVSMSNTLRSVWTLSEGKIIGAFYSELSGSSFMVAVGVLDSAELVIVTANGKPEKRLSDLTAIVNACCNNYEVTALVRAGSTFTGDQEETVDGEKFGLIYKSTVNYIHPVGDYFLKSTIRYKSLGPFNRPIQYGMTVGQVIFELIDGTTIAVDVSPDRQILSRISFVDKVLGHLQDNQNLSMVILVAGCVLLMILLLNVFSRLRRLVSLVNLMILEKRSRR